MHYKDTLAARLELMMEFSQFTNLMEQGTTPEIRQALQTSTPFSPHAIIGTLDDKVHVCHQLSILTGSTWAQLDMAYAALRGL